MSASIVWFRNDLRLADQPALHAAATSGQPVVPIFIWSPTEEGAWTPGAASRWWLHQSLAALDASLRKIGSRLLLFQGPIEKTLLDLLRELGGGTVYWNRHYEPAIAQRDADLKKILIKAGASVEEFNGTLLTHPTDLKTASGKPYQVFTPYWNRCLEEIQAPRCSAAPVTLPAPKPWPTSAPLASLKLEPTIDWASGFRRVWKPGEAGALDALRHFAEDGLNGYAQARDVPGDAGTSRLSPHLHFGEISPRQVQQVLQPLGAARFMKEVGWREFAYYLLVHFPKTPDHPLHEKFKRFPWRQNAAALQRWQRGHTGYPLVDAGMRELWTTGWMHNRVRMVVASFLVKDLLISWKEGARWFWDTLVDADLANNTLGWQWAAGCGADAAPYFRIFNPVLQGERFDPEGVYVRRWVPELAKLSNEWIHKPFEAPPDVLEKAGIRLGRDYAAPVVRHAEARDQAMAAFRSLRD